MQTPPDPTRRPTVFASYSSTKEDDKLYTELKKHLKLGERLGHWEDVSVPQGQKGPFSKLEQLKIADIILLLISSDFIASDYCYTIEMTEAMRRHKEGKARVIPILLRPVHIKNAPFVHLRALPSNGKTVTEWENQDEAFTDIAKEFQDSVNTLARTYSQADASTSYYALANEFMRKKQYLLALQYYDYALQYSLSLSEQADVYIQKGIALDKLERYDEAVHAYREALQRHPSDSIDVTLKKGWSHYRLGAYEKALKSCEDGIKIRKLEAYKLKYYTLCRTRQYLKALEVCKQAIDCDPNFASAYDVRSWAFYHLGYACSNRGKKDRHYRNALLASEQAIDCDPNFASAYNNKGRALNQLRKYADALNAYTKAITLYGQEIVADPLSGHLYHKLATVYDNLGIAYRNQGEHKDALRSYKNAVSYYKQERDSNHSDLAAAYKHIGESLIDLEQFLDALKFLKEAQTTYDIVYQEFEGKGENNTSEYAADIARVYVNQARAHNALAKRNPNQKDKDEHYKMAEGACRKAIRLSPEDSTADSYLGEALEGLGSPDEAKKAYDRAAELKKQGK